MKQKQNIIKWNGSTHLILMISKFYSKEIGMTELREINPLVFCKKSGFSRELFRLETMGYIKFTNKEKTKWIITNAGYSTVYSLAKEYSKNLPTSEKDRI